MNTLKETRDDLMKDLLDAESQAFEGFLKKTSLKTLNEYEASRSNEAVKLVNERKNSLIQKIDKSKSEIEFMDNNLNSKALAALENILR